MALIPMHNPLSPVTFMSDSHEALILPLLTYTHDDTFSEGAMPTSGIDPIEQPEGMLHCLPMAMRSIRVKRRRDQTFSFSLTIGRLPPFLGVVEVRYVA